MVVVLRVASIFLMALGGVVLSRRLRLSESFARELSLVLVNFIYPCLIVSALLRNFTLGELVHYWMLPAGLAGILLVGGGVGAVAVRWVPGLAEGTRRSFVLSCLMNNYSFLPVLIVGGLWGERGVALVSFAGLGAELVVWSVGVKVISGARLDRGFVRQMVSAPIVALAAAIVLLAVGSVWVPTAGSTLWRVLTMVLDSARAVGLATVPVAALVCGMRLAGLGRRAWVSRVSGLLGVLRLAVVPAVCLGVIGFLPLPAEVRGVLCVLAVQPCAMFQVSLAEVYGIDSGLAASAVLVSHVGCLISIPVWLWVLGV